MKNFCGKCGSPLNESNTCPNCGNTNQINHYNSITDILSNLNQPNYYIQKGKENIIAQLKNTIIRLVILALLFSICIFPIPIICLKDGLFPHNYNFFDCMNYSMSACFAFCLMFIYLISILFEAVSYKHSFRKIIQKLLLAFGIISIFLTWFDFRSLTYDSFKKFIHIGIGGWFFIILLIAMMIIEYNFSNEK